MSATRVAELLIEDQDHRPRGRLTIALLPQASNQQSPALLLDRRSEVQQSDDLPPVQLLEGAEYRYNVIGTNGHPTARITTDRPEVFQADSESGEQGRVRPTLHTGTLPVAFYQDGEPIGTVRLEVRSRKLDYLRQYRWMLRDISEAMAEIVMERFGTTEQRFAPDGTRDAATLYQRFAFLRSQLYSETLEAAIGRVLARPHVAWEEEEELVSPRQGARVSSRIARQFASGGPSIEFAPAGVPIRVPETLRSFRTQTTFDNVPNQFVKFALVRWREVTATIRDALERESVTAPVERGLKEADGLLERLDGILSEPMFREISELAQFPGSSEVLQKGTGYRDIYRAFIEFELAARLSWSGGEDVYSAGQRDVAALYEYWVFVQMARIVADVCGAQFDLSPLLEVDDRGFNLALRRGVSRAVSGTVVRLGRHLRLELFFNRTFGPRQTGFSAWTQPMRPDCSLLIRPEDPLRQPFEEIWVHFDAKYRVEALLDVVGPSGESSQDESEIADGADEGQPGGRALRADLLKMHAYRDAIRRSAGAYVLYPGTETASFSAYHELLPGLGAFGFRPTDTGDVEGGEQVRSFLSDVLDHVGSQLTQHERGRFWQREAYSGETRTQTRVQISDFIRRPPADTIVLIGYVKDTAHLEWIQANSLYNVRADDRTGAVRVGSHVLAAEVVILYDQSYAPLGVSVVRDVPRVMTQMQMVAAGYPEPKGSAYYCFPLLPVDVDAWPEWLTGERLRAMVAGESPGKRLGAPVGITWLELATGRLPSGSGSQ